MNSVLGDIFKSCAEYMSQPMSESSESGASSRMPDLGAVYQYIGALLASSEGTQDIPVKLNG